MESNRKRTGGPQDDELDSAGSDGELAGLRRSLKSIGYAVTGVKSDIRVTLVVGGGTSGSEREISGETCRRGDAGRSQSLRSTAADEWREASIVEPTLREGGQEGGCRSSGVSDPKESIVPAGANSDSTELVSVWMWLGSFSLERMHVGGAGNGVKGGRLPPSLVSDFSPKVKPGSWRTNPDEETTDWRAVCGRTARTVRRAGRA